MTGRAPVDLSRLTRIFIANFGPFYGPQTVKAYFGLMPVNLMIPA